MPKSKVTTAHCVAAIIAFLSAFDWTSDEQKAAKNWKRRSKKGSDDHCTRIFENKKDDSIIMTVVSAGDRIQGVGWDKNQTLKDAQVEAVSKATGATAEEVEEMAAKLEKDYEPCTSCGTMLKKGAMEKCDKCGEVACKRCLLEDGIEVIDEEVEVFGKSKGSKLNWCAKCLGQSEHAYVDSVPYEELPILMGRSWRTTGTEGHLLDRLKRGE